MFESDYYLDLTQLYFKFYVVLRKYIIDKISSKVFLNARKLIEDGTMIVKRDKDDIIFPFSEYYN